MVYLVSGAPRAGKTTISRRFTAETGIGHFGIDYLKMGLARGAPVLDIDPVRGDWITAEQLRPILEGMIRTYVENGEDYLIEGSSLLPESVAGLRDEFGPDQVRSAFVGYAEIDTEEKMRTMRTFAGEHRDWVSEDDDEMRKHVEHLKEVSRTFRDECVKFDLPYFESRDHVRTVDEVVDFLVGAS